MLDKVLASKVFARDKWLCRHCRLRGGPFHPHHVIYQSHQGPDTMNNLLTLCWQCHSAHHDGKLRIEVVQVLEDDVAVKFTRLKGWGPS